ncbi:MULTISPECIES: lipid kinase YegS [unclassified Brenneria]|uniref:lipid kinase YegS n=1 Tax=unclassified Brenneria TaxID=2634434 RepID=UPI001553EDF2|nr:MULTISPECIES: lipid kinase YegS [unclassified Brenneria]MBJ7223984.1 lipid kinase YegS [Brenneria sp. L3-3C-1]MEE3645229.1 lipid kinase YegS [Brenneria sp. L3_3C_1]MEE3652951.1 lipid kinase YegS [Brenneria sp. HEZEL_4_2_4]NPD02905.1 lipid kinase YegS [Brenneria sp. hezel4-2-4]
MVQPPATLLILNGKSAGNEELRQAVEQLRQDGYVLHVRVTWEFGDARRYVEEAVRLKVGNIIAAGGDGTINEVAGTLAVQPEAMRPCLGIIPLGTANDFATSCQIPVEIHRALTLAIKGRPTAIDLAVVNNEHYFINMATGGFATRITTETPAKMKAALGGASYILHALLRMDMLQAERCEIRGPDFSWSGDTLVIAVGNGRQAGGGQLLCPEALVNDGLLELSVLSAQELLPNMLQAWFTGNKNQNMISATLPWLEITAPDDMTFNLDGEPLKAKRFHIEIVPAAIQCRLPPQCALLG